VKSLLSRKKSEEQAGFNPNQAAGAEKKAGPGLTVRRIIMPAMIVSVLVVLFAAGATYLQFTMLGQQRHDALSKGQSERMAAMLAGRLEGYADVMFATASQPAVQQALGMGDRATLEQHAGQLRRVLPDVLRVKFLRVGEDQIDESTTPSLGYACLDLARVAEGGQVPPIETHLFGSKDQHIDLLQASINERNVVLGSLLVSLDVAVLKAWVQGAMPADGGYAELRQGGGGKYLMLAAAGDAGLQNAPGAQVARVAGSSWELAYWAPATMSSLSAAQQGMFFAIFGAAIVVIFITFASLMALTSRIVKNDLVNAVKQALDMWGGQRAHTFEVKLAESLEVLSALEQRIHELQPKPTVKPDAAKAAAMQKAHESGIDVVEEAMQVEAPPMSDAELPSSLMFMDKDAVQVEEIDSADNNGDENKDK